MDQWTHHHSLAALRALGSNVLNSRTVYCCRRQRSVMDISFGFRHTMISRETAKRINCPDASQLSNSRTNSWVLESFWGIAIWWFIMSLRTVATAGGQLKIKAEWSAWFDQSWIEGKLHDCWNSKEASQCGYWCCNGPLHYGKRIGVANFANDFCINCRDDKEEKIVIHLLLTRPALCQKKKRHLAAYYTEGRRTLTSAV